MSTQTKATSVPLPATAQPVNRCPICNATVSGGSATWTDYVCGARVSETHHGSWTLSLPCKTAP